MGEDRPTLFGPGAVRSDAPDSHGGSSPPIDTSPPRSTEPSAWRARLTAARATASSPRFLGLAGILLVLISAGIIVAGIALPGHAPASLPPPVVPLPAAAAARDTEGVPLDGLDAPDPGSLRDCDVKLGDWAAYAAAAAAAEQQSLGFEAAAASADVVVAALRALPPLQLPLRVWVLHSPGHPWSPGFLPATALQAAILDAAFSGMRLRFRLDGVYGVAVTDAEVEGCGTGDLAPDALLPRLLTAAAATANATAVQVILCNPDGVNGASQILGSATHGGPMGDAIVLRRSALWLSRTSLTHQLGHFLGLGHPYPDSKTCKYDADAIVDTPQQYQAAGGGCDAVAAVPLCDVAAAGQDGAPAPGSAAAELSTPIYGFMEITNDTCRRHFTPGQVLRARAMLGALRPTLAAAAAAGLQRGEQVAWEGAFQSAPPPAAVIEWQLASLTGPRPPGAGRDGALPEATVAAAERLTSALGQARGAAGAAGGATSAGNCSCVGPDAAGDAGWTGRLGAPFFVDAVRLVQPWDVVAADAAADTELLAALASPKAGPKGGAAAPAAALAPAPATERVSGAVDVVPVVEVRVGPSPRFQDNALCGRTELPRGRLAVTLPCNGSLPGPFVTVQWVQQPAQGPMCLCDVAALSQAAPPLRPAAAPAAGGPGALLNATAAGAVASQSSTAAARGGGGGAALALAGSPPPAAATGLPAPPAPTCSATEAEEAPWWSMQVFEDAMWVRGVRLMAPSRCHRAAAPPGGRAQDEPKSAKDGYVARLAQLWNATEVVCGPEDPLEIDIFVGDAAPGKAGVGAGPGGSACAKGIRIMPGQLTDVACEGWMQGSVVTVALVGGGGGVNATALAPSAEGRPAASASAPPLRALELCSVQPIGGVELVAAAAVAAGRQSLRPDSLLPFFSVALDGDVKTCIDVPSTSEKPIDNASWETAFIGAGYVVAGLDIAGLPAAGAPAMEVILLDGAGQTVWSGGAAGAGGLVGVEPPTPAVAVRISGFASLCEVTFVAAGGDAIPVPSDDGAGSVEGGGDARLPDRGAWTATATPPPANTTAALDGDPRTCAGIVLDPTDGSGAAASVLVSMGGARLAVPFVQILANASAANVTVSVVTTATGYEVPCGEGPQGLQPWTVAGWACPPGAAGDALALRFLPPAPGSVDDVKGHVVGLCEVWGVGVTLAPGS